MVYFIHYKQGLWYQSVTPRKPKAETFPGLTPRWVSNPMYIVSKVDQPLHYIYESFTFVSKAKVIHVIHSIYKQHETSLLRTPSSHKRIFGYLSNTDLRIQAVWKSAKSWWVHKRLVFLKMYEFLCFPEKVVIQENPIFS